MVILIYHIGNVAAMTGRMGRRGVRTREMVAVARERMDRLFKFAEQESLRGFHARANRYSSLAVKIGMRYNIRLRKEQRIRCCKVCNSYQAPGVSCRVRLSHGTMTSTCANCGYIYRIPYEKKKEKP